MPYCDTHYSVTAGEGALIFRPRGYRSDSSKRVVIHSSGAAGTALSIQGAAYRDLPYLLADQGIPVISLDLGNNAGTATAYPWGNDIAATDIETARTGLLVTHGFKNDKMGLLGGSGGGANVLQYARQFPSRVAAIGLHIGLVGLQDLHDNNRGGYQAAINTQYGGGAAFTAALPAHDPAQYTAAIEAISCPKAGWWASDDPLVVPATVDTFCAGVPSLTRVNMGAVGHTVPSSVHQPTVDFFAPVL